MNRSRICIPCYCVAALLFLPASSCLLAQNDPSNLDVRLFRQINNGQSSFKTSLIGITDNSVAPITILAPISLITYGPATDGNEPFESGVLLGVSDVLSYSVCLALKAGVKREPPDIALSNVEAHHLDGADPYSFPSGHTTGAFALATMLSLRYPKPGVYIPAFVWAGLVGYGRVYFGLHYPTDVMGGALIGAVSSFLVYEYQAKLLPHAYKIIGRKAPENVSALIVPNRGGMLFNFAVRF